MNNKETMEQKNKLIPELRFPEFMKDGEWKEKSIEKVLIESRIPSIENDVNKRITVRLNLKGIEKREVRGILFQQDLQIKEVMIFYQKRLFLVMK
jgi:hypothetical protein